MNTNCPGLRKIVLNNAGVEFGQKGFIDILGCHLCLRIVEIGLLMCTDKNSLLYLREGDFRQLSIIKDRIAFENLPMVSMKLDQSCVSLAADAFHHVSELDLDAVGSRPDIFRWVSKMSLLQIIDMTFEADMSLHQHDMKQL